MLMAWAGRRKTAQATALRARIVLACAEGLSNGDVAVRCGANIATVRKWRSRFVGHRLAPKVREWLAAHPRFHLHFIPTSSS